MAPLQGECKPCHKTGTVPFALRLKSIGLVAGEVVAKDEEEDGGGG
jgi:hypothetical protein